MNVIEICAPIEFGQRCVESIGEYDQRKITISKCDTQPLKLVLGKLCLVDHSDHLCPNALSHNAMNVSYVAWK